jgi:hypothetical protein
MTRAILIAAALLALAAPAHPDDAPSTTLGGILVDPRAVIYHDETTMRAFVLDALKAKGLDVRPDDLLDLRKPPR